MCFDSGGSGGGGGQNSYDPLIGQAAMKNAELADKVQNWSMKYFDEEVSPYIKALRDSSIKNEDRTAKLFDFNYEQAQQENENYRRYGAPAAREYYEMVRNYSEGREEEKMAQGAIGDVRTASAVQDAALDRRLQSAGVDPTSPAAIAARTDAALVNTAASAAAANKARNAARTMGIQLKSDAANFSRGGLSNAIAFSGLSNQNAMSNFGVSTGALGAINQGAAVPMSGYSAAMSGYGANLNAYTSRANSLTNYEASLNASNAQSDAGFGQFMGALGGAAISAW